MKYLIEFFRLLFPLRSQLILQNEYLRAQLAQKDRRIVELTDVLIERQKPAPKERPEPKPCLPVPPIAAWKTRLPREKGPDDYEEAAVETKDALHARGQNETHAVGAEANKTGDAQAG